jgi:hypothetical protein
MAKAVGMTQLFAPGTQGQPNLSGLMLACWSASLNFQRHSQCASWPRIAMSQWAAARSVALPAVPEMATVTKPRAVVQEPSLSPTNEGQLPSRFCHLTNGSFHVVWEPVGPVARARVARQVASTLA